MEALSGEQPACAAVLLSRFVDDQLNGAARQFADATSETQASGADLGEGNAYIGTKTVT